MSKLWPKVIRDPVHNIIPFEDTDCDRLLLDLINTREFQRLRRIKQLGMSELVFPGANHSRFSHCIGAMHIARLMLDRTQRLLPDKVGDDQRTAVLVAALVHDIGHGPFSHAFEKVTGQKHEARTLEIITKTGSEVNARLRKFDKTLPSRLAVFFDEDIDAEKRRKAEIPEFLTQIVSSQLDADRFDYLLRDSYATGTDYGRYDLNWLVLQLRLDASRKRYYLSRKAFSATEAYIFARYHMYQAVYFHKAVRAAEVMVRLIFKRYRQLLGTVRSRARKRAVVPDAPPSVFDAFADELSLDRYLALDDTALTQFFKACASAHDEVLRVLGGGIIDRKLYKGVDATDADAASIGDFASRANDKVRSAGLDPEYAFVDDTAADTPYKPYDPDESRPASQIYVETAKGANKEISTRSDAVAQLKKKYALLRYYFPESMRAGMEHLAKETLAKEDQG